MTSQDQLMTPRQVTAMVRKIERHKIAIGKHRDALREIIEDVESICDESDCATENLESAVDALSKYL